MPLLSKDAETMAQRNVKRKRGPDDATDPDNDAPGLRSPFLLPSPAPSLPPFQFQTPSSSIPSPSPFLFPFTYQIPYPSPSLSLAPSPSPSLSASSSSSRAAQRTNTPKACIVCRDKKCKCDGNVPVCGPCGVHGRQCGYSLTVDKRKRHSAELANETILMLEGENARLHELSLHDKERIRVLEAQLHKLLQTNNIGGAHRPPALTLTVPDVDFGGGTGPAFRGASPLTSASSDSSSFPWSMPGSPSPWSGSSSLPSPLPQHSGQFLGVPMGLHAGAGGGYSTEDEVTPDSHMGLPAPDGYGESLVDMQEDTQPAAATLRTTTWTGPGVPPSPGGVAALSTSLSTMNFNASASQVAMTVSATPFDATKSQADIGPAFPDSGSGLIAPGGAEQQYFQMYGTMVGGFDVDRSLLFAGSSTDAAYPNEE